MPQFASVLSAKKSQSKRHQSKQHSDSIANRDLTAKTNKAKPLEFRPHWKQIPCILTQGGKISAMPESLRNSSSSVNAECDRNSDGHHILAEQDSYAYSNHQNSNTKFNHQNIENSFFTCKAIITINICGV